MFVRWLLILLCWSVASLGSVGVAMASDNFPGTTISGTSGAISGNTATPLATSQAGEPATFGGGGLNTFWYSWTAPASGSVTFETCGATQTTFDTTLQSFSGSAVGALTILASNDDTTGCATVPNANYGSRNIFNVTLGTVYRIQVDGYASATGTFRLSWSLSAFNISKAVSAASISAPGTLTYTISVANAGATTLNGLTLTDTLLLGASARTLNTGPTYTSGDSNGNGQINVGETFVYTATYVVPQSDIDGTGNYANTATMDTAQTDAYTSAAATTTVIRTPSITISKSWAFALPAHDLNGNGVVDRNDTITYYYAVANNGTVSISGIAVADVHLGSGIPPTPANETLFIDVAPLLDSTDATANNGQWSTLRPGDTVRFRGTYVITQTDIDNQ